MIHFPHFEHLTQETLNQMHAYSDDAVLAIMMIVAHESHGGTYMKQIGGPALGAIQMEPVTHESLWQHADNIKYNAARCGIVKNLRALEWDLKYNVFMARSKLLTDPDPLPKTEEAMSQYLKDFYNTAGGKAEWDDYMNAYRFWRKQS